MGTEQEDEEGGRNVDEDVLEVEQRGEECSAGSKLALSGRKPRSPSSAGADPHLACRQQTPGQQSEEEAVVLKVDVVDQN
jgi:hypothetical protein